MSKKKRYGCLKGLGVFLGLLILLGVLAYLFLNEPIPKGEKGPEAEALAQKMMQAVNQEAWDSTAIIQWNFAGRHDFLWDKDRNLVKVDWDENSVLLNTKSVSGLAFKNNQALDGEAANKLIQQAWGFFCNDSFWLNAVVKANDPGTERSLVKLEDGSEALMVTYTTGGVTPGDRYLWILDENGLPKSWKMWVSIIPIGGVEFGWDKWITLPTGAKVSSLHPSQFFDLPITNIRAATDLNSFGLNSDPFKDLILTK